MEYSREKIGNQFAVKAVAFVLCILLIASGLWFFANGCVQFNKQNVQVSNVDIFELVTEGDYSKSSAFQHTAVQELNMLIFGFESSKKLAPVDEALAGLEKIVPGTVNSETALRDVVTGYFSTMDIITYTNSDYNYIADSAYHSWMSGATHYWYPLTGRSVEVVFDFTSIEGGLTFWPRDSGIVIEVPDSGMENGEFYSQEYPTDSNSFGNKAFAIDLFVAFPEQFEQILKEWKLINKSEMENYQDYLEATSLLYYATDGETVLTNIDGMKSKTSFTNSDYNQNPEYLSVINGEGSDYSASLNIVMNDWMDGYGPGTIGTSVFWDDFSCFLSYPESYMEQQRIAYEAKKDISLTNFVPFLVCALVALILMLLLIVWTGRVCVNGERHHYPWDKFFMEGQIIIIAACTIVSIVIVDLYISAGQNPLHNFWPGGAGGDIISNGSLFLIAMVILLGFAVLWCLLSVVRNLKSNLFVRRSLIGLICLAIGKGISSLSHEIKTGFEEHNPLTKTITLVVVFWVLTIICGVLTIFGGVIGIILLIAVLIAAIYFTAQWVNRYGRLRKGIEEVSSGNVNYRIDVSEGSNAEFDKLSKQVNQISKAIETAVENELKNQRLKTDLITNVSHDLKTPLTSIITYTDLLKTEGLKSKNAPDYLDILEEKGQRLKKLTDDLFEAAKASSGDVTANMGKVDLLSLVKQEIAETETAFEKNGLEVIVNAPDEHFYINADGNLMWRVMENIFRNTGKYAQRDSRVYIDLRREERGSGMARIVFTMKNISASKLNIPADELMERFQRGDENRTSEGSGLGLAIARDLVRLQKGRFDIVIDGDLFKAVIEMEPYND